MYDLTSQRVLAGAAGAGAKLYVEDVFSTWLYTGNGSTQTITNGIDLSGKGGLVWLKRRNDISEHGLYDTARGAAKLLQSQSTAAQISSYSGVSAFAATGFDLGTELNASGGTYASWTFRKAAKFFDVVTYVGDGTNNRQISHSLGSTPGFIIVKPVSFSGGWICYHRSLGTGVFTQLNSTAASSSDAAFMPSVTATTFTPCTDPSLFALNTSGQTFVAYLFAHDAGGFGDSGNDNVISCGSYTGNGSTNGPTITLGWEPQWIMLKRTSGVAGWYVYDNMRGVRTGGVDSNLLPNSSQAEDSSFDYLDFNATGFKLTTTSNDHNGNGDTYIYIAIRRGPMKTPTDATKVFSPIAATASTSTTRTTGFPVDLQIGNDRSRVAIGGSFFSDRLRGVSTNTTTFGAILYSSSTAAESSTALTLGFGNTGFKDASFYNGYPMAWWNFRRAPGFFDVVAWAASASTSITHGLGVTPELIIAKSRSVAGESWTVYTQPGGRGNVLFLNTTNGNVGIADYWGTSGPTSTSFGVAASGSSNNAGNMIAYLFASCPGVSKVGSYTGTGTTLQVNCGFTSGARFVLIKRTDSTGDWYVWDSARGIVVGNDPYLRLNNTVAEITNTDYVDTFSSGFEISSTAPDAINANGGSFIFLAVA